MSDRRISGKSGTDLTLDYYDRNSGRFAADTVNVRFTEVQDRFLGYLAPGSLILDFGCGSGRDSRYFLSKGYAVEACDGSAEMVRIASQTAGIPVKQMLFEELEEEERYDGIFACSSILHVPFKKLPDILARMEKAVKKGGVIYVSFKYGTFEGMRSGRYFTDLNEERLEKLLAEAAGGKTRLCICKRWISGDVRPGREDEKWLNVILRREQ